MELVEDNRHVNAEIEAAVQAYFALPDAVTNEIYQTTAMVPQKTLDQWIHELSQKRETGLKCRLAEAIFTDDTDTLQYLGAIAHRQALIGARLKAARKQVSLVMIHNYYSKPATKRENK